MKNRWILHVREFGKIQSADIQIAPMTFFVGDNNSGKSYIMALLYSILNTRFRLQGFDLCLKSSEFEWCSNWLNSQFAIGDHTEIVDSEVRSHFEAYLNLVLLKNTSKIMHAAFNFDVPIGALSVTLIEVEQQAIEFQHKESENSTSQNKETDNSTSQNKERDSSTEEKETYYRLSPSVGEYPRTSAHASTIDCTFFAPFLLEFFLKAEIKPAFRHPAVFLPTSRTGFLLTYRTLLREIISDSYDSDTLSNASITRTALTRPCSDFLKNLSMVSVARKSKRFQSVITLIENKMLNGNIEVSESPVPEISYHPRGCNHSLPMHLSSGVVTELTPLTLMLQYPAPTDVLFIEEPEMGLHPELQAHMARVLIQIFKKRTLVFITTHSDTILQHINNMLKLQNLPVEKRKLLRDKFGFWPADLLSQDDIAMYQFDVNHETGRSTISRLECGDYGFLVPTFNEALQNLLNQSRSFEPEVNDDGD